MPIIKELFKPLIYIPPGTNEVEAIFQPKITIFVLVEKKLYPHKIEVYVDSGASRNLFPAEILKYLNIELDNGNKRTHFGIGGIEVESFTHEVEILIGSMKFKTEIDFSAQHKPHLVGMTKFFNHFDSVNFNMERLQLELSYSTKLN